MNKKERIQALYKAINCIRGPETKVGAMMVLQIYENYLDADNVGTDKFQGHAYFWVHEHSEKNVLRNVHPATARRIHNRWLAAGLDLLGDSPEHTEIIYKSLTKGDRRRLEWEK